ncbi:MAG: hypothetical protein H0T42_20775 [Deltaproteobacteria bacterium]|nr:hypothetical protein [Deltaproteobacteria bacterium]
MIDLGPDDPAIRQQLAAALLAGGLDPVIGSPDSDALPLEVALAEAQRAFGALDCKATIAASRDVIGIAAARQAAGLPVPELVRGWMYLLLCAERDGDTDAVMTASARLRALGEPTKYPEVDTMLDRDMFPVEIRAEIAGAPIWIDFALAGTSPLKVTLSAGEHVIASASGTRRGWAAGTAVRNQPTITVPMPEQRRKLGDILAQVSARVAIVRTGERIAAWGRVGRSEAPHALGGDDGVGTLAEAPRLVAVIADRVQAWTDRAPDPDQPLLVEDPKTRGTRKERVDEPTRWWVYAAILGAVGGGVTLMLLHDTASNTQRVELDYPASRP